MSILFVSTDNEDVRQMLENQICNRRATDSGFDVPMIHESVGGVSLHTFNLCINKIFFKTPGKTRYYNNNLNIIDQIL